MHYIALYVNHFTSRLLHVHKPKKPQPRNSLSLLANTSLTTGDSTMPDTDELLALCSGKFETQPGAQGVHHDSTSGERISELLRSTDISSRPTQNDTLDPTDTAEMSEILGLCSGVFPETQASGSTSVPFKKFGSNVRSREKAAESESEGEGGDVLSWAQRQRKLTSMLALARENGGEEDIMPRVMRKRKRGRPQPKATKG